MASTVLLITHGQRNCDILTDQLADLLHDRVIVRGACVGDPGLPAMVQDADLVVLSSHAVLVRLGWQLDSMEKVLMARRSIDCAYISQLLDLPPGTRALVVNDSRVNAEEVVELLYGLGFHHLWLEPYYPGLSAPEGVEVAITPGEMDLVPNGSSRIVDIGTRTIDLTTMVEVLTRIDMLDENANILTARSLQHLIGVTRRLNSSVREVNHLRTLLETTLHKVEDGVIAVDAFGRVVVFNQTAEQLLGHSFAQLRGHKLDEFLPELRIAETLKLTEPEENVAGRLAGRDVFVSRIPIMDNGRISGAAMNIREFRSIERQDQKLRTHLRQQGHVARHRFADIIAVSAAMNRVVERARTFTTTTSTVLIQGETGTGKELLAQAIHNGSPRSDRPFVAVNCAALPEDLLESELFGYAEGAFTGARRGGRQGVFEQAHLGSIFLDEIGDIPPRVQARLLRVLEERQVMRVGGERVSPIDVRVIAATNADLRDQVKAGKFRADLYYRLNVLHLYIPPLRDRTEDLFPLVDSLLPAERGGHRTFFTPAAQQLMLTYPWPGNGRELRNVIELVLHTVNPGPVQLQDLPADLQHFFSSDSAVGSALSPIDEHMLRLLYDADCHSRRLGRRSLTQMLTQAGYSVSEEAVRRQLAHLSRLGLVEINVGRGGTSVTPLGREHIHSYSAALVSPGIM